MVMDLCLLYSSSLYFIIFSKHAERHLNKKSFLPDIISSFYEKMNKISNISNSKHNDFVILHFSKFNFAKYTSFFFKTLDLFIYILLMSQLFSSQLFLHKSKLFSNIAHFQIKDSRIFHNALIESYNV